MDLMHLGFLKIFAKPFIFYGDEWQLSKEKKLCPENLIHPNSLAKPPPHPLPPATSSWLDFLFWGCW